MIRGHRPLFYALNHQNLPENLLVKTINSNGKDFKSLTICKSINKEILVFLELLR
jgi:hypothetical protein